MKNPKEPSNKRQKEKVKPTFLKRLRNRLLTGIIIALPLMATIFLISIIVNWVENIVRPVIPDAINPEFYLGRTIPGFGLIIAMIIFLILGFLASNFIGRRFLNAAERLLARVPFVRGIYGFIKQIVGLVSDQKDRAFKEVCLLEYPRKGCWAIGFVTSNVKGAPAEKLGEGFISVFVPTTPNPTSGFLLMVKRDEIKILNMTAEEGAKLVISGGMVSNEQNVVDAELKKA